MKKLIPVLIALVLLLTSCAPSEVSQAEQTTEAQPPETGETTESEELVIAQKEYTAEELEQMRLNVGLSVTDNSINLKSMYAGRMLYVPETDTLFYMQDDKLYQKNGDKTIVLAEIPALSLTLHDGKLYFIYALERDIYYDYHQRWGTICCLDLSTGEIAEILDVDNALKICLDGRMLYYSIIERQGTDIAKITKTYKVDLDTMHTELITENTRWQPFAVSEKYIVFTNNNEDGVFEIQITDKSTNEVKTYIANGYPHNLCVYGDMVYFDSNGTIYTISIDDMSVAELKAVNPWSNDATYIITYTIHGDNVVITTGGDIQIWSEERGEWDYYCPMLDSSVSSLSYYAELFSDGENLYVLNGGREWLYIDIADLGYDLILPDGDTIIDDQIVVRPLGDEE